MMAKSIENAVGKTNYKIWKQDLAAQPAHSMLLACFQSLFTGSGRTVLDRLIPNFFYYSYDRGTTSNQIQDGGQDLYDYGSRVYISTSSFSERQISYGSSYSIGQHLSTFQSFAMHPFQAVARINGDGHLSYVKIRIWSNLGSPQTSRIVSRTSPVSFNVGDVKVTFFYWSHNPINGNAMSLNMFYVLRPSLPNSSETFSVSLPPTEPTHSSHYVQVNNPGNLLFGFTLLARSTGYAIEKSHAKKVLMQMVTTCFP
jgi:hypothetical protein